MDYTGTAMATIREYRAAARTMYGLEVGDFIYDTLEWAAAAAFGGRVTAARPVILAPVEMGPYNRHAGWYGPRQLGQPGPILVNRHHVAVNVDDWFAVTSPDSLRDTLVHELTHAYQHEVVMVRDGGDKTLDPTRGPHRCRSWYEAVATAAPAVLGVEIPAECWPLKKSARRNGKVVKIIPEGTVSEVEMTHWPGSIRCALQDGTLNLPRCSP
jgi:hypothetical protein